MAAELDDVAAALLGVWDAARERATSRLSEAQLRTVIAVEQYDGINLRRLANLLGMLLSSASRLCDRLVAAGMLEREPGRLDRREISLHLTPAARGLLDELRADRQQRLAEVLGAMTPAGQAALLDGLREFDTVARARETPTPSPEPWPGPPGAGPPAPVSGPIGPPSAASAPAANSGTPVIPGGNAAAPATDAAAPAAIPGDSSDARRRPVPRSAGDRPSASPVARSA